MPEAGGADPRPIMRTRRIAVTSGARFVVAVQALGLFYPLLISLLDGMRVFSATRHSLASCPRSVVMLCAMSSALHVHNNVHPFLERYIVRIPEREFYYSDWIYLYLPLLVC
jgi:hypothetical protein